MVWENKEKGLQIFISDGRIQCDGLSEKNLGDLGNNTEEEELNIINQLLSRARNFCKEVNQQYDGRI